MSRGRGCFRCASTRFTILLPVSGGTRFRLVLYAWVTACENTEALLLILRQHLVRHLLPLGVGQLTRMPPLRAVVRPVARNTKLASASIPTSTARPRTLRSGRLARSRGA